MATPNNHISGKWTKEQREKAKALLQSWLRTHQKGKRKHKVQNFKKDLEND